MNRIVHTTRCKAHTQFIARLAFALTIILMGCFPASSMADDPKQPAYVPGEVLLGIQPEFDDFLLPASLSQFGTLVYQLTDVHWAKLKLNDAFDVEKALPLLRALPFVAYATPNG